ncbi:hypothetical protein THAOC_33463, partial [Thalassiosira oceanica]
MGGGGKAKESAGGGKPPAGGADGAGGGLAVLDLNITSAPGNGTVPEAEECADHPDYLVVHDDGTTDTCGDFLSTTRPAVLENRCGKAQPGGGENRTVRDYCRLTCGNCDGPALELPKTNVTAGEDGGAGGNETAAEDGTEGAEGGADAGSGDEADGPDEDDIFDAVDPSADDADEDEDCYDSDYVVLSDAGEPTEKCAEYLATGRPAVLENRCRKEQPGGLLVRDYCRLTCSNCDADPVSVVPGDGGADSVPGPAPSSDGMVPTLDAVASGTTASPTLRPVPGLRRRRGLLLHHRRRGRRGDVRELPGHRPPGRPREQVRQGRGRRAGTGPVQEELRQLRAGGRRRVGDAVHRRPAAVDRRRRLVRREVLDAPRRGRRGGARRGAARGGT